MGCFHHPQGRSSTFSLTFLEAPSDTSQKCISMVTLKPIKLASRLMTTQALSEFLFYKCMSGKG